MKSKFTLILIFLLLAFQWLITAQTLVDTAIQPRNAVLEEFTGINCPNCPDGHIRAEALAAAHPGRVVLINVHTGSFATPSAGQPDFRTQYGTALDAFAGVAAYPSGTMNRVVWPGTYNQPPYYPQNPPNNLAIRRPGWWDTGYPGQGTGEYIILHGGNSPVNIGCQTTWNDVTRELTVDVELYYTSSDSAALNKLNVVFTENNVIGYQSGGSSNYNHKHILREMITGQWGDSITQTTSGTLISKSYTYTVPSSFVIENCEISLFVTRDNNKHTHTGVVIPAKNGTTVGIENHEQSYASLSVSPNPAGNESQIYVRVEKEGNYNLSLYNLTGQTISSKTIHLNRQETKTISVNEMTNFNHLQSGIYFIKLGSGDTATTSKLIVE